MKTFLAPFLAAWAALLATPAAQASTSVDQVDIIDGQVDVNEDGHITAFDDSSNVLLFFNDAAPIRVDIIDGLVDVTENGAVTILDDLSNFDLNDLDGITPTSNQMDIIDGFVDVNQDGIISARTDDAIDVKLVKLLSSVVDKVDIIDGHVDVDQDGIISVHDGALDVLLAFDDGALIRVDVSGSCVDVTEFGLCGNDLINADLNDLVSSIPSSNQVDIINGGEVDVNEDGDANTLDDATDVKLVKLVASVVDVVDIIDGQVDVTRGGAINEFDDL